ncbi:MAG: helix-turn-helix domain-containing protein [Bdellovibrionales bacterium]|nr:helix-turn-helix domain-containing protein [Bdellovibrionales bacterium]
MNLNDDPSSLYDTLELTPDATPQEIRSAYLRLKSAYNKESIAHYTLFSREETDQMLQRIENAYLTLSNPEKRKTYDSSQGLTHQGRAYTTPMPTYSSTVSSISNDSSDVELLVESEQDWSGSAIRRIREARKITLEDLADFTRISKAYLQAIEDEDYKKLPAVVYCRGFLQQIAKRLKLPNDQMISKYIIRMKAGSPDKA